MLAQNICTQGLKNNCSRIKTKFDWFESNRLKCLFFSLNHRFWSRWFIYFPNNCIGNRIIWLTDLKWSIWNAIADSYRRRLEIASILISFELCCNQQENEFCGNTKFNLYKQKDTRACLQLIWSAMTVVICLYY